MHIPASEQASTIPSMLAALSLMDPLWNNATDAAIWNLVTQQFGPQQQKIRSGRYNTAAGFLAFRQDDTWSVIVEGTRTREQFDHIVNGYQSTAETSGSFPGLCRAFSETALRISTALGQLGYVRGQRLRLWGHSLGGAGCFAAARYLGAGTNYRNMSVGTCGSPKPGTQDFARSIRDLSYIRHMNLNDPVPFVFPTASQIPLLIISDIETVRQSVNPWVQPGTGPVYYQNGTSTWANLPDRNPSFITTNLASWLYTLVYGGQSEHQAREYVVRLQTYSANFPAPIAEHPQHSTEEQLLSPVAPVTQQQVNERIRQAAEARGATNTIAQIVANNSTARMQRTKINGIWGVTFLDNLIVFGLSKRSATKLAREGNELLATLAARGVVYDDILIGSMGEWLRLRSGDPIE